RQTRRLTDERTSAHALVSLFLASLRRRPVLVVAWRQTRPRRFDCAVTRVAGAIHCAGVVCRIDQRTAALETGRRFFAHVFQACELVAPTFTYAFTVLERTWPPRSLSVASRSLSERRRCQQQQHTDCVQMLRHGPPQSFRKRGVVVLRWSAAAPTPAGVTADPDHLERCSAGGGRDFLAFI